MPRREKGTGSVSQRKDGTWTARVILGYKPDGKPKVKALYAKTEKEVKRKLREYLKTAPEWNPDLETNETVEEFLLAWLHDTKSNTLKPSSVDRVEQAIRCQIVPEIGYIQAGSLQSIDVQRFINKLRDEGYSYTTIKHAYLALYGGYKTAVLQGRMKVNPARAVTLPKKSTIAKKEFHYYTEDELQKIFDVAANHRLGDAIMLDANTGLRLSELCGLRWKDIDMENRILSVRNTRVRVKERDDSDHNYVTIDQNSAKSKSSIRDVYLNDNAIAALERLQKVTGKFEYVLSTKSGKPSERQYMDKMFRNIVRKAGFPEDKIYGFHALRHSFASILFANDVDVKTVSELLGHSSVSITYSTYIHLINDEKQDAVMRIKKYEHNVNIGESTEDKKVV